MRNPKWDRDEIILALDLYFSPSRGSIDATNPQVIELSKILNALPLFPTKPDEIKFRNPNGVSLKLSNFLAIDPNHKGKGMTGGSKLDEQVFNEFTDNKPLLHSIATEIKNVASSEDIKQKIRLVEEDEESINDNVIEGRILYKLHKVRERDKKIVTRKKDAVFNRLGHLACEACAFEFETYYGEIGKGFIECHHCTPLSKFKVSTITTLEDLAVVCSNCHRMLHKRIDTISIEDLKMMIKYPHH